jgi:hypothetical protein
MAALIDGQHFALTAHDYSAYFMLSARPLPGLMRSQPAG